MCEQHLSGSVNAVDVYEMISHFAKKNVLGLAKNFFMIEKK